MYPPPLIIHICQLKTKIYKTHQLAVVHYCKSLLYFHILLHTDHELLSRNNTISDQLFFPKISVIENNSAHSPTSHCNLYNLGKRTSMALAGFILALHLFGFVGSYSLHSILETNRNALIYDRLSLQNSKGTGINLTSSSWNHVLVKHFSQPCGF